MGFKRKKGDGDGEEMESEVRGRPSFNTGERRNVILPSMIKNKDKRAKVYAKQKHEKKVEKQKKIKARDAAEKQALELGEEVNELEILIMLFDFWESKTSSFRVFVCSLRRRWCRRRLRIREKLMRLFADLMMKK